MEALTVTLVAFALLQGSTWQFTSLPFGIGQLVDFLPGPSAKVSSLELNGFPDYANRYKIFCAGSFVLMIMYVVWSLCTYRWQEFNPVDNPNYLLAILGLAGLALGWIVFAQFIDFEEPIRARPRYNIHESVIPYLVDIGAFALLAHLPVSMLPLLKDGYAKGLRSDGSSDSNS